MKKTLASLVSLGLLTLFCTNNSSAQALTKSELNNRINLINTAVPFLLISPDSRSGGMGELGVSTDPDVWSMHWNPAKYAFIDKDFGVGLSYAPWLRNLNVTDVNIAYLSAYKRIDKMQTVAMSFEYFTCGNIEFTDEDGTATGESFSPREFLLDAAYSRLLTKNFSLSMALRYIYSNLTGGATTEGSDPTRPGQTAAADIAGYYVKEKTISGLPTKIKAGFHVSNLGGKISYSETGQKDFLPANLKLGTGASVSIDKFNEVGMNVEFSKLLVPTPPYEYEDENNETVTQGTGDYDASVATSIFNSFSDAPGGLTEEMSEVIWSVGAEYWYMKQFALRGGYFHESPTKGNRKFFTVGLGLRMNSLGLDAAYLIPTSGGSNSPLSNTWRISLTYEVASAKKSKSLGEAN